jgi:transcriptional regulator with XRE-family HTH domain
VRVMNDVTNRFVKLVKEARNGHELTQVELGKMTDLSGQFISKLESGNTNISLHHAFKILGALNLCPCALSREPKT